MIPLASTIIDRINSIIRRFLLGGKMRPVAWSKVCLQRCEGGLGLRDLSTWNKALLAKVFWSIHSKSDSLWIRWIHAKYLRGEDVWEIIPNMRDSPLIKIF